MINKRYPHLNSPIMVRNTFFCNRLMAGPGIPIFAQSSENFPCDGWIANFAEKAKTGAGAVVSIGGAIEVHLNDEPVQGHFPRIDFADMTAQHRFADIAEVIKAQGSIPVMQCMPPMGKLAGYDVSDDVWSEYVEGDGSYPVKGKECPKELLYEVAQDYGKSAELSKILGFKMVQIHMAYRNMFPGRFLSRFTNKRTDEFGGSLENRARFPLLICEEIKKACGDDFLISVAITAEEPGYPDGLTLGETCDFLRLAEGKIDIISIREHQIDFAQGLSFTEKKLPNRPAHRALSKFIRDNNIDIKLAYVCGAHDLDDCEDLIASGDADFILTSRAFLADPEFAVKMREGRNEDVVPCLRCSRCHHDNDDSWTSVCSVNPKFPFLHRMQHMVSAPGPKKKIAVIGGGCAGMKAAMECVDRGHDVTIYEKEPKLGGQLNLAGVAYVKWTLEKFRNYLAHQIEKRDIKVFLNTEVKPGQIDDDYDIIIVALGAVPLIPDIPGINNAMPFDYALTHPDEVKGDIVFIGGGEIAVENALHFIKMGHKAMCIEMKDKLAAECPPVHYRRPFRELWESTEGFSWELNSKVTAVSDSRDVIYIDSDGEEKSVKADTVIIAAGTRGLTREAMAFGGNDKFRFIGDCLNLGNIAMAMRTAYFTAHNI